MAARYINAAVQAVYTAINTHIVEFLDAVSEEEDVALTNVVAINKAHTPYDNRSPKIDVFYDGFRMINQNLGLIEVQIAVEVMILSEDVDFATAQYKASLYDQAIIDIIDYDGTLGGLVVDAYIDNLISSGGEGDKSHMIIVDRFNLRVRVQTLRPA